MQKTFTEHKQTRDWSSFINDREEILHREAYYKWVLTTCSNFLRAVDKKIETTKDEYEKCKFEFEQQECDLKIESTKNYYKHWSGRKAAYDAEMVMLNSECNLHYNFILVEDKKLAERDLQLATTLKNWETYQTAAKPGEDSVKMKTDSYVFMKKYIVDHYEYKLKSVFELPKVATPPNTEQKSNLHKVD